MKRFFEEPTINVKAFMVEDIITTSGDLGDADLGPGGLPIQP